MQTSVCFLKEIVHALTSDGASGSPTSRRRSAKAAVAELSNGLPGLWKQRRAQQRLQQQRKPPPQAPKLDELLRQTNAVAVDAAEPAARRVRAVGASASGLRESERPGSVCAPGYTGGIPADQRVDEKGRAILATIDMSTTLKMLKARLKKDPDAPKKPMSAYIAFAAKRRYTLSPPALLPPHRPGQAKCSADS